MIRLLIRLTLKAPLMALILSGVVYAQRTSFPLHYPLNTVHQAAMAWVEFHELSLRLENKPKSSQSIFLDLEPWYLEHGSQWISHEIQTEMLIRSARVKRTLQMVLEARTPGQTDVTVSFHEETESLQSGERASSYQNEESHMQAGVNLESIKSELIRFAERAAE